MHEHVLHTGSFLVVPCGQYKQTADSPTLFTAYVYARGHWAQPFLRLPATNKVNPAHAGYVMQSVPALATSTNVCKRGGCHLARTNILAPNTNKFHNAAGQCNLAISAAHYIIVIKVCCTSDCNRKPAILLNV